MPIIINETDNMKVYFSSDWHLNHTGPKNSTPLWKMRKYLSPIDMTSKIISGINNIVRENDILFFLGDLCLNTPKDEFSEMMSKFKCKNIWMLWGNHNNPHKKNIYNPIVKEILSTSNVSGKIYPCEYNNIKYIGDYIELVLNNQYIVLFHYPIWEWNHKLDGAWMLHGHSHYLFTPGQRQSHYAKILDVSWDGHFRPLGFLEIKEIMIPKGIPINDHHIPIINNI